MATTKRHDVKDLALAPEGVRRIEWADRQIPVLAAIRDRFESQEFLAIMIPAMLPPPTPLKLFEFAAGVFEMKTLPFLLAIFCGKLTQFLICSLLTIWFGPTLIRSLRHVVHQHLDLVIGVALTALLWLVFYMVRKVFDRRKGISLPVEEEV